MDRTAVVAFIAAQVSDILGTSYPIAETDRLDDLPLDSLQCLELTAAIEDEYGIEISCSDRISIETISEFADLVLRASTSLLRAA